MKQEINPEETKRALAFEMWLNAPMPMVTLVKTMDVSRLARLSRKSGVKFNTLMCWCIGKAATATEVINQRREALFQRIGTWRAGWQQRPYPLTGKGVPTILFEGEIS